ncbi:MAG: hypothetical protein WEB37_02805 [Bacteroidota bacterium]
MKTHILVVALVFIACNSKKADEQTPEASRSGIHRTMIQGIWWSHDMPQVAAFQVNDSTFYYPDHFIDRKYEIKGDSLFVFFEDNYISSSAIVKLTVDTLILSTDGTEQVYTRAEPLP